MFSGCSKLENLNVLHFIVNSVLDMAYMFKGCSSLISLDLSSFDTSSVTNMMNMFSYCSSLIGLDLTNFKTQTVTNMNSMFLGCSKLESLDLYNFNVYKVSKMNSMFKDCVSLKSIKLFEANNVEDMSYMFFNCPSLDELNLTRFKFSKVLTMEYMFSNCLGLTSIIFPEINDLGAINLSHMFSQCGSLISLFLPHFSKSSVINMEYMFKGCISLSSLNIINWDTSSVTTMENMFSGCSSLITLDLSSFDTKKVKLMNGMFYGCSSLEYLNISNFNTNSVINMAFMFYKLKSISSLNVSSFDTNNVKFIYYMFEDCESLTSLDLSNFETPNIKSMDNLFSGCSSLEKLNINKLNTQLVSSMNNLFSGCRSLKSINLSNFDTSRVTSIYHMFSGCMSLKNLSLDTFNTSLITNMEYLFYKCSSLEYIDLSNFITSSVTNMGHMFSECSSLIELNLDSFETNNVESMDYMFSNCITLLELNLSNFNTSLVKNFSHMFDGCKLLDWIDCSNFSIDNAENMEYMFYGCENLGYINLLNAYDSNIIKYYNIFGRTPENMVFCFNESNKKFIQQIYKKNCYIINCENDWREIRKLIVASSSECVDSCKKLTRFLYKYKCYERCPQGTYPHNFVCTKEINEYVPGQICDIKNYFMGNCNITLTDNLDKHKFVINTTEGIMNADLYDIILYVLDNKKIYTIREKNEIYQIYSLSNKIRFNDLAYVDLDECGKILKEKYKLKQSEDILVFKIEYRSPDFKIPIIEYCLFGRDGSIKLNLNICNKQKINYYIPLNISEYKDYEYNPNNNFYYDKCQPIEFSSDSDLTLYERRNEYNINNMSLCESQCIFKGYINQQIICECDIKIKFNSYLNNIDPYNFVYRFKDLNEKNHNLWLFTCLNILFKKGILLTNYGSYIILSIFILIVVGVIIFYVKEKNIILNDIKILFQETADKLLKKELIKAERKKLKKQMKKNKDPNSIYGYNKGKSKSKGLIISKEESAINAQEVSNNIILNNDLDKTKEFSEKTENEINYSSYETSIKLDKRTFIEYYMSLIKTKQLFVFSFYSKKDYNSRVIKVCYLLFLFAFILIINTLFIEDTSFHNIFKLKGSFDFNYHIYKIIYATVTCYILEKVFHFLVFTEMDIIKIRKNDGKDNEQKIRNVCFTVSIKCVLFFSFSLILLFIFWLYISCFCAIFKRTQIFIILISVISFGLFLVTPFIMNLIPPIFRMIALKDENISSQRFCLYRFSQILQFIL